MIHTFDATEEEIKLEVKLSNGRTKIFEIAMLSPDKLKKLNVIEKGRTKIGNDLDKLADLVYKQIEILAPNAKHADFNGMSIGTLLKLVAKMTELGLGTTTETQKKSPVVSNRKISRSRRRASA